MKKFKKSKIFLIVAFVCLMLGGILIGVGFIQGGDFKYLSINKETASWWPFNGGVNFPSNDISTNHVKRTYIPLNYKDLKEIDIEMKLGDVTIVRGSKNDVYVNDLLSDEFEATMDNGVFSFRMKNSELNFNINRSPEIIVELTDTMLMRLYIDSNLGDIDVKNIRVADLNIESDLGDVDVEGIYSESTKIKISAGDIDASGKLLKYIDLHNNMGNIDLKINGNERDYNYEVSNSLGDTTYARQDYDGHANFSNNVEGAKYTLKVKNNLGDIDIKFQ